MGFSDLPPELFEQILVHCDLRQILRCKAVSKSFNTYITHSARLAYHIDLFISGFEDDHLSPRLNLQVRRAILSAAQGIWRRVDSMALLQTLHVSNLEYWPIRDSVLLRKIAVNADVPLEHAVPTWDDHATVRFDVSQISSRLSVDIDGGATSTNTSTTVEGDTHVLTHWQIRLQKETGSIACIDAAQDLLVVRYHSTSPPPPSPPSSTSSSAGQWYSLSMHSLKTGARHPRALGTGRVEFRMSLRVTKNPHYTRVQVLDDVLAVNMASGFQLFTETAFFDWTTGELKGMFCSPGTSARAWGHPAVLISPHCFLQPCYSAAERRPAIEVYVLDDRKHPSPDSDNGKEKGNEEGNGKEQRDATHVATYWLPRVNNGDVRLIINITSRQQVTPSFPSSPSSSSSSPTLSSTRDAGFLLSSSYARMLHVQITGVWFTAPFQCAFFTPAHQFIDDAVRFLSLPSHERGRGVRGVRERKWSEWGNGMTRWLEKPLGGEGGGEVKGGERESGEGEGELEGDGEGGEGEGDGGRRGRGGWQEEAKSNLRGSGSRYAFSRWLVDFAPLDVGREVHRYLHSHSHSSHPSSTSTNNERESFESTERASFESTEAPGWTTYYHTAQKSQISGAEMFDEEIVSRLPYREREVGVLPGFEAGSDVLVVGDKVVTVQGGALDVIKIYKPVASDAEKETDKLAAALAGIRLDG